MGDYLRKNTDKQLSMLLSALPYIEQSTFFIIKPHPACPINMDDLPGIYGELTMRPIAELLPMSDIVYASTVTSAAVDAYCSGLPVVTMLNGNNLNLNPLRGCENAYFPVDVKEFLDIINSPVKGKKNQGVGFFYLDTLMPRWRRWLDRDINKK